MQVACLFPPYFLYDFSVQLPPYNNVFAFGTIGTCGCFDPGAFRPWQSMARDQASFANPHYNIRPMSHFLHPWAASHKQVPVDAIWYQNLHSGNIGCGGYRPVVGPQR